MYSRTPYLTYGGTHARKQQDVRETWTSDPAIPPSACTDDYMQWFLPRSDPRIRNPLNISRRFHVPVDPPMPPQALLDLVAREARREDAGKEEKFDRIADLLLRHYRAS
ncbi:hypothetical protein M9H77_36470 [Catharanthus roseus]|uniref:Uncharacterized protein n=1 Tax=Catharanthus roseus TaxID=4058 RepID=A0ACB9ZSA0_CATRO|nr:hypothetical protein M9H77_36470 [Catharanthus roseus]